jgi:hypothetical protein
MDFFAFASLRLCVEFKCAFAGFGSAVAASPAFVFCNKSLTVKAFNLD